MRVHVAALTRVSCNLQQGTLHLPGAIHHCEGLTELWFALNKLLVSIPEKIEIPVTCKHGLDKMKNSIIEQKRIVLHTGCSAQNISDIGNMLNKFVRIEKQRLSLSVLTYEQSPKPSVRN